MELANLTKKRPFGVNPWVLILFSAVIPLVLFAFVLLKWYRQITDFRHVTAHFLERQNVVMAYDAMEISTGVSDLLEKTARDIVVLALFPLNAQSALAFYKSQISDYTQFGTEEDLPTEVPLPFYNRIYFLGLDGSFKLQIENGSVVNRRKTIAECKESELCDAKVIGRALSAKTGDIVYGTLLRYYSKSTEPVDDNGASLAVAYKAKNGVYVLGMEYRHLRDHLTSLAFPYEKKRNLLQSYLNGNYIYLVDSQYNIIAHPKHWNVLGIDKRTGLQVPPMRTDADDGTHPINIAAYQQGTLKEYFQRLLTRSFGKHGVDLFEAANLAGTKRVLSVAPILLSKGQFKKTGIFGYVVISCSIDYFSEPKERFVPYY